MKIKIIAPIPVGEKDKPEIGRTYDVTRVTKRQKDIILY